MMKPISTKEALKKKKEEEKKAKQEKEGDVSFVQGSYSQLNVSVKSKTSKTTAETMSPKIKEPFVYNYKPPVKKVNLRETARQKMAKEPRTFGNSIETLDLSDNDLEDKHGQVIVNLIKNQAERRNFELWL